MSILYIVASPIGNLEDISLRALRILKEEVLTIYCEDTRVSRKLLNHYQIDGKKLISFNKENEGRRVKEIVKRLDAGEDLALVSDAGTPLISDPGLTLIQALQDSEHRLVPIPGASSLTAALAVCPINTERFIFEGFLPHGPKQRRRVLRGLLDEERPIVVFESPHRLMKTLADIEAIMGGDREIFIAREITKKFEQHYHGTVVELKAELEEQFAKDVVGELVLVI